MTTLNENQAKLFTDRNWGVIATIREDGSPQATPVWIDYDGENVLVNSALGRTKVKNIERDPRATVTVLPAENQQSGYVMVSGSATIVEEGALNDPSLEAIFALHCQPLATIINASGEREDVPFRTG